MQSDLNLGTFGEGAQRIYIASSDAEIRDSTGEARQCLAVNHLCAHGYSDPCVTAFVDFLCDHLGAWFRQN